MPLQIAVRAALQDGSILSGRIADMSATGARPSCRHPDHPGTRIRVGSTEAVVVRADDNGIGA